MLMVQYLVVPMPNEQRGMSDDYIERVTLTCPRATQSYYAS